MSDVTDSEISFPALGWLHEDTTAAYVSHRVRRPRAVGMSCLSEALANSQCLLPPRADVRLVTRVPRKQSYTRERAWAPPLESGTLFQLLFVSHCTLPLVAIAWWSVYRFHAAVENLSVFTILWGYVSPDPNGTSRPTDCNLDFNLSGLTQLCEDETYRLMHHVKQNLESWIDWLISTPFKPISELADWP